VAPFYLLKAKELRDEAEPKRARTLTHIQRERGQKFRPLDYSSSLDALEGLALAVILSVAAIEAHANDAIGRLDEAAMVETRVRVGGQTITVMRNKAAMDRFRLSEKLTRAVPLLTGLPSIKGTQAWQTFRQLNRLRNDLVHVRREARNDPDKPSPFGRLLLGDGSRSPEEAASVHRCGRAGLDSGEDQARSWPRGTTVADRVVSLTAFRRTRGWTVITLQAARAGGVARPIRPPPD
jgi:hypothetical protein